LGNLRIAPDDQAHGVAGTAGCDRVGPLIFPEWTGYERHAPTPGQVNAEIARLHELTPEQLDAEYAAWQAGIEADVKGKRATSEAAGVKPSGIREGLEKLCSELAEETNKLAGETNELEAEKIEVRRRALQRTIENLSGELVKPDERLQNQIACARSQLVIDLLAERVEEAFQPGLAARKRWWEVHAAVHDEGRAGGIRARACRPGLPPVPFGIERWAEIFPPPGESRAIVDGIPARIFLAKGDLETVFAADKSSKDRSGPGRPSMLNLIMHEMVRCGSRRRTTGEEWPSWHREAAELAEWAKRNRGKLEPPTKDTIERQLRDFYKELQALAQ